MSLEYQVDAVDRHLSSIRENLLRDVDPQKFPTQFEVACLIALRESGLLFVEHNLRLNGKQIDGVAGWGILGKKYVEVKHRTSGKLDEDLVSGHAAVLQHWLRKSTAQGIVMTNLAEYTNGALYSGHKYEMALIDGYDLDHILFNRRLGMGSLMRAKDRVRSLRVDLEHAESKRRNGRKKELEREIRQTEERMLPLKEQYLKIKEAYGLFVENLAKKIDLDYFHSQPYITPGMYGKLLRSFQ